jgi:dihydroorotate dehydrogenase (NAD+) catalytic subunit
LWVKLSPNVTDIRETAKAAEAEGADAVSLVNTFVGAVIDVEKRRPVLANLSGGLSGPAIRPLAVWMTWQVRRAVAIPIVGMGGIMTARDAVEFILAGATAVQVGTANFVNPRAAVDVIDGLAAWMSDHKVASVRDLVGAAGGAPERA